MTSLRFLVLPFLLGLMSHLSHLALAKPPCVPPPLPFAAQPRDFGAGSAIRSGSESTETPNCSWRMLRDRSR